jgi:hypothetical protein
MEPPETRPIPVTLRRAASINAVEHILANEGGYNPSDMNGKPVNFGINQGANPGHRCEEHDARTGQADLHDKYWVPSGAENLPANLQTPYFDVYIRNPAFAKKALAIQAAIRPSSCRASNLFPEASRASRTEQKYAKAWANRDAKNLRIATGGSAGGSSADHRQAACS